MARSNITIYSALVSNVAIAAVKFIAGSASGSAAMISEGVHSLVDSVLGLMVVFMCLVIGQVTGNPYMDGVASLLVGLILTVASALLARESRSLLIGEGISAKTEQAIIGIVKEDDDIVGVPRIFSIYQSPEQVLLVVLLAFRPELTVAAMTDKIDVIKEHIRRQYPKVEYIIVQPQDSPLPPAS